MLHARLENASRQRRRTAAFLRDRVWRASHGSVSGAPTQQLTRGLAPLVFGTRQGIEACHEGGDRPPLLPWLPCALMYHPHIGPLSLASAQPATMARLCSLQQQDQCATRPGPYPMFPEVVCKARIPCTMCLPAARRSACTFPAFRNCLWQSWLPGGALGKSPRTASYCDFIQLIYKPRPPR